MTTFYTVEAAALLVRTFAPAATGARSGVLHRSCVHEPRLIPAPPYRRPGRWSTGTSLRSRCRWPHTWPPAWRCAPVRGSTATVCSRSTRRRAFVRRRPARHRSVEQHSPRVNLAFWPPFSRAEPLADLQPAEADGGPGQYDGRVRKDRPRLRRQRYDCAARAPRRGVRTVGPPASECCECGGLESVSTASGAAAPRPSAGRPAPTARRAELLHLCGQSTARHTLLQP